MDYARGPTRINRLFHQKCRHDVHKLKSNCNTKPSNLSKEEWTALINLKNRNDSSSKQPAKETRQSLGAPTSTNKKQFANFRTRLFTPKSTKTYNLGQKLLGKLRASLHFAPYSIVRAISCTIWELTCVAPLPHIQCWGSSYKRSHHFLPGKSNINKREGVISKVMLPSKHFVQDCNFRKFVSGSK